MANVITTQTIIDGPRNLVIKVTGTLDTSDVPLQTIVTPSTTFGAPPFVNLMHVDYAISDQLELQLQWQGTPNAPMMPLAGRGRMSFIDFGGLPDNAVAATGNIQLLSTGWASGTQIFTLILEMTKKGQVYRGVR